MHDPAESHQIGRQMIQLIVTSPDPQTMLSRIARKLGEIFRVDACLIIAGTSPADTRQIGFWQAADASELRRDALLLHPVGADVLAGVEPLAISDLQETESDFTVDWLQEALPVRALLKIATHFQGTVNGTIAIGNFQAREWTNSEKELLKIASESVAIAISQAQLQQQAQTSCRYQTLLQNLNQGIARASDIESILNLALTETAKALQVDGGLILMLKYKEPLFKSRSLQSLPKAKAQIVCQCSGDADSPESPSRSSFDLSDSVLCQKAWKNAPQPLAIAEQGELLKMRNPREIPGVFQPEALSAVLMVPLLGSHSGDAEKSVVLGFLVLLHRQPRSWQPDEIELVKWVGTQVSTAIIHDKTLRQVQSLVEERTAQLKWSLEVQAKLSEKMRQQIKELRRLNQLKDEFLATVSDNFKHPLTKMKMAIKMLNIAPDSHQRQRYLEILESECAKEINLVNDLLTLQQLESNQFNFHPQKLDLKDIISELAQSFEQEWEDRGLTLTVDYHRETASKSSPSSPLNLYTDPDSLKRILKELLMNAGKFADPDTTVCLDATEKIKPQGNQILLTLTNLGQGISPEEQEYIFDKFRRVGGDTDGSERGTGLGLALVKSLVEHLNGTIEVSSCSTDNPPTFVTAFTLTLPQFQPQQ